VSSVTFANFARLELCLWGRIRFHKVQAQLWQPLTPLSWFHFLAALMLSLCNCPYENQVHQNKCIYLLPWGEWSSFETDADVRSSLEQYHHCKQRIWFMKVLFKNTVTPLILLFLLMVQRIICCIQIVFIICTRDEPWSLLLMGCGDWGKGWATFGDGDVCLQPSELGETVNGIAHGLRFARPNKAGSPVLFCRRRGWFPTSSK